MSNNIDINYIKGLAEGQKIEEKSEEGKLLASLIDVVLEQNRTIQELEDRLESVEEFRDDLDEGFREAEHFMNDLLNGDLPDLPQIPGMPPFTADFEFEEDEDEDDDDMYEVTCPSCDTTYFTSFQDFLDDEVVCPNCGEHYELSDEVIQKLVRDNFDE